jgi:hypothetical protein
VCFCGCTVWLIISRIKLLLKARDWIVWVRRVHDDFSVFRISVCRVVVSIVRDEVSDSQDLISAGIERTRG